MLASGPIVHFLTMHYNRNVLRQHFYRCAIQFDFTLTCLNHLNRYTLTYEAMTAPEFNLHSHSTPRGKVHKHSTQGKFLRRLQLTAQHCTFQRDLNLITSPLSKSRAALCEILAIRTLREYGDSTLELAFVTTTSWRVYSGADEEMLKRSMEELDIDDLEEHVGNAIEMAIIGRAKRFIKSSACQKVIDSIWRHVDWSFFPSSVINSPAYF